MLSLYPPTLYVHGLLINCCCCGCMYGSSLVLHICAYYTYNSYNYSRHCMNTPSIMYIIFWVTRTSCITCYLIRLQGAHQSCSIPSWGGLEQLVETLGVKCISNSYQVVQKNCLLSSHAGDWEMSDSTDCTFVYIHSKSTGWQSCMLTECNRLK